MYVLLDPSNFSISFTRSRDISSEAMFANVQSASPTAYILEWFMSLGNESISLGRQDAGIETHFFKELVTSVSTSWLSSSKSMIPR
jgi:hypothetical protein